MPKFKKTRDIEGSIKKNQKTNSGIYISAGEIEHSDFDKKDWLELQKDYTNMRNGHGLLSTTIDILKYPILMSEHRMEGENTELNAYVMMVLDNLQKGFAYFKRHKLLALDFGLSMFEVVVEKGVRWGGKLHNMPVWYNPIQNETIYKFLYNEQGMFQGIEHERRIPEGATEFITIDNKSLDYWSYNEEYNDVRGRSMLRPIRYFWDCQNKTLRSKVQGIQRGAGIAAIKTKGKPSSEAAAAIEEVGRTISTMPEGYISYDEEKLTVELLEPKGQADAMAIIEWLDRQIVFNSLSQFLVAGIGQNGSRSATGEHKSAYEMAASNIMKGLEENLQITVNNIIGMSGYANTPRIEWPQIKFNAITQTDLQKTANELKALFDSRIITKQPEDEDAIREMFSLPKRRPGVDIVRPEDAKTSMFEKDSKDSKDSKDKKSLSKKKERNISLEMLEHEKNVFSLDSAIEHYEEMETKLSNVIDRVMSEYIDDIYRQLSKDRKKTIHIKKSIMEALITEITDLYGQGYNRGERDVKAEVKKIGSSKLTINKKEKSSKNKIVDRQVNKLFFNVKSSIENKMAVVSDQYIAKKGGLKNVVVGFETGFKQNKNSIKSTVEAGYIDGRGDTMESLSDEIDTFLYTAVMDAGTCVECSPFDGLPFTATEINEEGFNFTHPVNPNCLGGDNDRCQWIPLKLK